jgi:P-type conjugative transfer protein TrbJ
MGFDPRMESINAVEAWFGSLPGHGWYDVRRPLVNTQNLADILPLTSIWPGLAMNPCPHYPKNTPALCYGATTGSTPFRLNLHVGDTGHTGIYGPTGSGKSVALGTIAANFRAILEGQVFSFDKGYSAFVLTKALGGQHLDLGEDEVPLQPLARIDDETDRMKLQSQETATVTNLAQQLQYAIKNTTGGGAGVWQSNQNLLTNLGNLINEQEGLSYTFQGLTQQFQQLYPGFNAASTAGVQSPQATFDTTLNTLNGALASAQAQAQNFQAEQASLQTLELKSQTAIGNLQAVQVSNEIALAQVQQVQMLRQLVMAEMNSQNVAAANQLNNQVQSSLEAQALLSAPPSSGIPDILRNDAAPPPQP